MARTHAVVGRYVLHAPIARGGMATIHLARLLGAEGFERVVAAKRLHPHLVEDAEFVAMFLDEARIASRIHHPNVVPVLDVVQAGSEVILVQEYVHGLPLDKLLRAASHEGVVLPVGVAVAIGAGMLAALAAAHGARDELGAPLGIVHRDVSPQNVLVGADGIARLLDFGVAKATVNRHITQAGMFKGKLAYTAPEQIHGVVTPAIDIHAASVVLWEALAGRRLHPGLHDGELIAVLSAGDAPRLLDVIDPASIPPERLASLVRLDAVLRKGMAFEAKERWTAAEMAEALVAAAPPAAAAEVARWVKRLGKDLLDGREKLIAAEESTWRRHAGAAPAEPHDRAAAAAVAEPGETGATLRPSELPALLPRRRRLEWPAVVGLVLLGALSTGVLTLLLRPRVAPPVAAAPAPSPYVPVAPATAPPASSLATAAPATPDTVAASSAPLASAAPYRDAGAALIPWRRPFAPVHTAPSASTAPAASAAPTTTAAPAAPRAAPVDCNPPFYFDGKKKVFKAGCL